MVKKLIKLRGALDDLNKADILLVWSRFKPAAMIELSYFPKSKISKKEFLNRIDNLKKILDELSLKYKLNLNFPKSRYSLTKFSFIARDKKTLSKLIKAQNLKDPKKRRLQVGLLMGYPKTAVKAFANNESIDLNELPEKIIQSKEINLLNFRLSKHWRSELKYLKKKSQELGRVAPELHKRILNKKRAV